MARRRWLVAACVLVAGAVAWLFFRKDRPSEQDEQWANSNENMLRAARLAKACRAFEAAYGRRPIRLRDLVRSKELTERQWAELLFVEPGTGQRLEWHYFRAATGSGPNLVGPVGAGTWVVVGFPQGTAEAMRRETFEREFPELFQQLSGAP